MEYILVIWTVVGFTGTYSVTHTTRDWRPIGEFKTEASCKEGGRMLGVDPKNFRCLKK